MDIFGASVSMSGNLVIVGAPFDDDSAGKAYIYRRAGLAIVEEEAILTADPRHPLEAFGGSVSISGNTAVVGARFDDDRARDAGAAYVFEKIDGTWRRTAKLTAPDAAIEDHFGAAVSISGNTIAIGAPDDDDNGRNSGSVYIFVRAGDRWSLLTKLAPRSTREGDFFGLSLHLKQNRLIIGAPFANAGVPGDDVGETYIYERIGNAWRLGAHLENPDLEQNGHFGLSVSIDGNRAIIGAPGNREGRGRAYIVRRSTVFDITLWLPEDTLMASDGERDDNFGSSVSIDGDLVVVGAPDARIPGHIGAGVAYVFRRNQDDNEWMEMVKRSARDGEQSAHLGDSIFLEGRDILVGAPFDDNQRGRDAGGIYMFPAEPEPCCADLNRDGILDADDFFLFLDLFKARHPHADFVGDGRFDAADFFRYTDLFGRGCP